MREKQCDVYKDKRKRKRERETEGERVRERELQDPLMFAIKTPRQGNEEDVNYYW